MNARQIAARQLLECGFGIVPIKPGGKVPSISHGVNDAMYDQGATDAWYARHPDHGVGVCCKGFIVFDLDCHGDVDGIETLREWEREHGQLPDTLAQTTPSGGYHMVYRATEEVRPSVNQSMAVDVRAWGSYIVCDPTPGYCWEVEPEPAHIADADERVLAFLAHVQPSKVRRERVTAPKGGVAEGGRNEKLYKMACSLKSQEWDDGMIRTSIEAYNLGACRPPLPQGEIDKILASVSQLPSGKSEEAMRAERSLFTSNGQPRPNLFARRLIDDQHACIIDGAPAIWVGDHYAMGWTAIDRAAIGLHDALRKSMQAEVRHYISRMAPERQAAPPNYIGFRNGVYDMDSGTLLEPTPDIAITNVVPHDWDDDAVCPEVDAVLNKMACGDTGVYLNLIEIAGVCMYRSAEYGQAAVLLGTGSNGKSTYIRMLRALLGDENISSLDLGIIGRQFQTGRLLGKLANLGDDISNEFQHGDILATFKKVATGERVYTDVKGADGFEFAPYCQLVFSANEFPRLADYSEGMMRRIFPVEFNAVFLKTDTDYDPRITEKVTTERACQRLAVLGLAGLGSVRNSNGFTPTLASRRRLAEIEQDNDTVLAWLTETGIDADRLEGEAVGTAYQMYSDWVKKAGQNPVSKNKFSRSIRLRIGLESVTKSVTGEKFRVFTRKEN